MSNISSSFTESSSLSHEIRPDMPVPGLMEVKIFQLNHSVHLEAYKYDVKAYYKSANEVT